MENNTVEELLNEMYNMIQDARSVPLSQEKCIVDRERALDLMEEIMNKWPTEVRDAQAIIASRTDLIAQARREGEGIIRNAKDQADKLITEEAIYQETRRQCQEMVEKTQSRMAELRRVSNDYMDDALRRTEEAIALSLEDVRDTRSKFKALVEAQEKRAATQDIEV